MSISILNRQRLHKVDVRRVRRSLARLLKEIHQQQSEVTILFVDDEEIRSLNNLYFNKDRGTNVISFSMREGEYGEVNPQVLGDIVISIETAARDAALEQMDLMDEVDYLLIHGLLHLTGYNHEQTTPEEAERMAIREKELFFQLRKYAIQ